MLNPNEPEWLHQQEEDQNLNMEQVQAMEDYNLNHAGTPMLHFFLY